MSLNLMSVEACPLPLSVPQEAPLELPQGSPEAHDHAPETPGGWDGLVNGAVGGLAQYGVFRVGGMLQAVPVGALKEVVPVRGGLAPMPSLGGACCGSVLVRGTAVPVLDMRLFLGLEAETQPANRCVVLLEREGWTIGILAEEVKGMGAWPECAWRPVGRCGQAQVRGEWLVALNTWLGEPVGLLDVAALFADSRVVKVMVARVEGVKGQSSVAERQTDSVLLFECEGMPLAVRTSQVQSTRPATRIESSALSSDICQGVGDYLGGRLPVLDTLRILGLGQMEKVEQSALLVIRLGSGYLAWRLDKVIDIVPYQSERVSAMPPLTVMNGDIFEGVYLGEDGVQYALARPEGLAQDEVLRGLSSKIDLAVVTEDAAKRSGRWQQYLVFRAGAEYCCEVEWVGEILRYPERLVSLSGRGEILGVFQHRGETIPLLCLSRLLGHQAPTIISQVRVLVVRAEQQVLGLAVHSLSAIERVWKPRTPERLGATADLVPFGDGEQRRMLRCLNLASLCDDLSGEDAVHRLRAKLASSQVQCSIEA